MKDLSPKQERFVKEYLIDLNGTQAAIRAGYSQKTAESQASRLLGKAKVQAAIQKANAKVAEKLEITHEKIVDELASIGFSNIRDHVAYDEKGVRIRPLPQDTRAVAEVSQKKRGGPILLKLHDKISALTILANRLYGTPKQPVEHSGEIVVNITRVVKEGGAQ